MPPELSPEKNKQSKRGGGIEQNQRSTTCVRQVNTSRQPARARKAGDSKGERGRREKAAASHRENLFSAQEAVCLAAAFRNNMHGDMRIRKEKEP